VSKEMEDVREAVSGVGGGIGRAGESVIKKISSG